MTKNILGDEQSGPGTVVGVNVALTGTLKDQNDIVVHGMVDGEVISERTVSVGQTAQVKGPVRGALITIAGVVRGEIVAGEKLEVLETGKIYGSIETRDLVVHSGALIEGKVSMKGAQEETHEEEAEVPAEEAELPAGEEILKPDEE